MAPKIKTINQVLMFPACRGQVQLNKHRKLVWNFVFLKSVPHSTSALAPGNAFWLADNCHTIGLRGIYLTSGYGLLFKLRVTLFEARSRIFLPIAKSCAALFYCRLANGLLPISWKVSTEKHVFTLPVSFFDPLFSLVQKECLELTLNFLYLLRRGTHKMYFKKGADSISDRSVIRWCDIKYYSN